MSALDAAPGVVAVLVVAAFGIHAWRDVQRASREVDHALDDLDAPLRALFRPTHVNVRHVPMRPDNAAVIGRAYADLQPGPRCEHGRPAPDGVHGWPCWWCATREPEPTTLLPR